MRLCSVRVCGEWARADRRRERERNREGALRASCAARLGHGSRCARLSVVPPRVTPRFTHGSSPQLSPAKTRSLAASRLSLRASPAGDTARRPGRDRREGAMLRGGDAARFVPGGGAAQSSSCFWIPPLQTLDYR